MGGTAEFFVPVQNILDRDFFYTDSGFREKMEVNLFMNERLENIRQEISDGVKSLTNSKEVYEFKKNIWIQKQAK